MERLLECAALSLEIDGNTIYSDVTLALGKGSLAVLCGRNGAGKSQLLRTLKGLVRQTSGTVSLSGQVLKASQRLARIALVFQNADLQAVGETVEKDVAFGPENLGWKRREIASAVDEAIALMGLEDLRKHRPATLSGGEKRRLAIAGVLAMKPEVILLDEPFAALDYPSTKAVLKALLDMHAAGHSILVVSHEIEKFLSHVDQVFIMSSGKLIHSGSAADSLDALREAQVYVPPIGLEKMSWLQE